LEKSKYAMRITKMTPAVMAALFPPKLERERDDLSLTDAQTEPSDPPVPLASQPRTVSLVDILRQSHAEEKNGLPQSVAIRIDGRIRAPEDEGGAQASAPHGLPHYATYRPALPMRQPTDAGRAYDGLQAPSHRAEIQPHQARGSLQFASYRTDPGQVRQASAVKGDTRGVTRSPQVQLGSNTQSNRPSNNYRCQGAPNAPGTGSLPRELMDQARLNAKETSRHKNFYPFDTRSWFKSQVQNKGPWDYKQYHPGFQNFGNYNYGYVGTTAGIPARVLLRKAGQAQIAAGTSRPGWGTPGNGWWGGEGSFGDDPADQVMIQRGIDDRNSGC
jgi:hypothetical protein